MQGTGGIDRQARAGRLARPILLTCLALGLALPLASCRSGERPAGRVLLIGIDGASPKVIGPMLEAGRLPHLAALAREGVWGKLRSVAPLYSPRLWASIATGKAPGKHGVAAFVKPDGAGGKRLYTSHDRKVPALWNILSARGFSLGVVNWWTTYPPERIDGVMISDHFFPEQIEMIRSTFKANSDADADLTHPVDWAERSAGVLERRQALVEIEDPFAGNTALPHWVNRELLSQQFETDYNVARVALEVEEQTRPDVMMVFLPGIDRISHWLWGNLEPEDSYPPPLRPTPEAREAGAEALRRYYEFTDALIGRLVADRDANDFVMVVSDHGFEAGVSLMLLTGEHETSKSIDGVVFARGRGIPSGIDAGHMGILDVTPTVLAWLGLPAAKDMDGRPAGFLLESAPETIASYDDTPVERIAPTSQGHEAEIVEHLRALGYLEEEKGGGEAPAEPTP